MVSFLDLRRFALAEPRINWGKKITTFQYIIKTPIPKTKTSSKHLFPTPFSQISQKDIDKQFKLRTEGRQAESEAVDKAIEILTSDESREALHGDGATAFLQVSTNTQMRALKSKAFTYLKNKSLSWSSVHSKLSESAEGKRLMDRQKKDLALVASAARLNAFTKVKELIDKMVEDIKGQIASDKESKDTCTVGVCV